MQHLRLLHSTGCADDAAPASSFPVEHFSSQKLLDDGYIQGMAYGPLELTRYVKDDGRTVIVYTLRRSAKA
jgi:hypothetical protein